MDGSWPTPRRGCPGKGLHTRSFTAMDSAAPGSTALGPPRVWYARSLSHADDKLRSFRFYLRWMCINQFNAKHAMVSWSVFLLLGIFVFTASHFVLSYAPTHPTYDVVV
ncbi:hypothetical protein C4D60_Mb06t00020 [Musa balbisiana]|uniref:Uncharacterized protein n=1 Tax=Musa balbisiana TaxID=52838 RepID=A0A4S8IK82_MUSBA|nr:hypothetical protein C4D60_Mb06t00020 [Musa balbisiana]